MEKKTTAFKDFTSHRAYLLLELLGKPQTAERKSWGNNPFWGGGADKRKGSKPFPLQTKLEGNKKRKSAGGVKNQLQFFPSASGSPDLKMVLRPDCCLTGRKKEVCSAERQSERSQDARGDGGGGGARTLEAPVPARRQERV